MRPPRAQGTADDGSRRLSAGDLPEAGAIVQAFGSEPHGVGMTPSLLVERIRLEQCGATRPRVVNCALQQCSRYALTPFLRIYEKAYDRPHRFLIHTLHHRRALQPQVVLPRPHRGPADRPLVPVGDQPRHGSAIHEGLHSPLVCLAPKLETAAPRSPIVHTPAAPNN